MVDYLSHFCEIDQLGRATSSVIIQTVMVNFSCYGIPSTVITDNVPQFSP